MIGTGAFAIPKGTTAQRDTTLGAGIIRYNTDLTQFEGYDGTNWFNLTGIQDLDGDTKITPELTSGANDNTIRFIVQNNVVATLDTTKFVVPEVQVDDININGKSIIESSERVLYDLAEKGSFNSNIIKFDEAVRQTIDMASNAYKNEEGIVGVPTGLSM